MAYKGNPKAFVILPDRQMLDAQTVMNTTLNDPGLSLGKPDSTRNRGEAGLVVGPGTPDTSNQGAGTVAMSGSPEVSNSIDIQPARRVDGQKILVNGSGGVGEAGAWVWKFPEEPETPEYQAGMVPEDPSGQLGPVGTNYRGEPDPRMWWCNDGIYGVNHTGSPPDKAGRGMCGVYNQFLRKEFLYCSSDPATPTDYNVIQVAYRDCDARWEGEDGQQNDYGDWLYTTFRVKNMASAADARCCISVVTLGDGAMRLMVKEDNDMSIYHSIDGLTWSLVCSNLVARFADRELQALASVRMVDSGGYLRIVGVEYDNVSLDHYFTTWSSGDRGATWRQIGTEYTFTSPTNDYGGDSRGWDMVGVDDNGATFCLFKAGTNATGTFYYANGDGEWLANTALDINPGAANFLTRVYLMRSATEVFLHVWRGEIYSADNTNTLRWQRRDTAPPTGDGWNCRVYKINRRTDFSSATAEWYKCGQMGNLGAQRFAPYRGNGYALGAAVAFAAGQLDTEHNVNTGTDYSSGHCVYFRFSGWSKNPIWERRKTDMLNLGTSAVLPASMWRWRGPRNFPLWAPNWMSIHGRIAGGGTWAPTTGLRPWEVVSGNGTTNWNPDRMRIKSNSPYTGHAQTYKHVANSCLAASNTRPAFQWYSCDGVGTSVLDTPCGVSVGWVANLKSTGNTFDAATDEYVGVRLKEGHNIQGSDCAVHIGIWWDKDKVVIRDHSATGAGAVLGVIAPDTSKYGTNPFYQDYWEFRYGYQKFGEPPVANGGALGIRQLGTEDWLYCVQEGFYADATGITNQHVEFGLFDGNGAEIRVEWKRFGLGGGFDNNVATMGNCVNNRQFWRDGYNIVTGATVDMLSRGRECMNLPIQTVFRQNVTMGGGGFMEYDTYTTTPTHRDGTKNLAAMPSPSYGWETTNYMKQSTAPATTVAQIFDAGHTTTAARFRHNAVAVFGTNARRLNVFYSHDGIAWASVAGVTFGLAHHRAGRFPEQADGGLTINPTTSETTFAGTGWEWRDWAGDYIARMSSVDPRFDYYLTFQEKSADPSWPFLGDGTNGDSWKIKYNIGEQLNQLCFEPPVDWAAAKPLGSVETLGVALRGDRAIVTYPTQSHRYMKLEWVFDRMQSDGRTGKCGSILAGMTLPLTVPLDWSFDDSEEPNTTVYRSRGAVSWAYTEGPPQRVWSATLVGDATEEQRSALRDAYRTFTKYDETPLVVALQGGDGNTSVEAVNSRQDPRSFMLATVKAGGSLDNAGYAWNDAAGKWFPVGDMGLKFEEEL